MSNTEKTPDTSNNLEQAIVYYNNKQYIESLNILTEALKTEPDNLELNYWFLKTMCHAPNFNDKRVSDMFEKRLLLFYGEVPDNQFKNLTEELEYILKASDYDTKEAIAMLMDDASDYKKAEELSRAFSKAKISYLAAKLSLAKIPIIARMGGSEKKETPKDCDFLKEQKEFPPLEDIGDLEYGIAIKIFGSTTAFFQNNQDSNVDFAREVQKLTIAKIFCAKELLKDSIPEEKEEGMTETRLERMKQLAEIMAWELNAVARILGKPLSIVVGSGRIEEINELDKLYTDIKKIDSSFQVPPLPSREGIQYRPSQSSIQYQNNRSGGCYVATAVYGSYDCPEVWTLRRYRDIILSGRWYGRAFIRTYYAVSPTLVRLFGKKQWFNNLFKPRLDKLVRTLNNNGIADTPYYDR